MIGFCLLLIPVIAFAEVTGETCKPFYHELEQVPHESIFQREGIYNSRQFETSATGCFLVMNTSRERLAGQRIPNFSAGPGTRLYEAGWRVNQKYAADGPGTMVTGLEKDEVLCLVYEDQPTYLNDDGNIAGGEFLKVRVECMEGAQGRRHKMILREKK